MILTQAEFERRYEAHNERNPVWRGRPEDPDDPPFGSGAYLRRRRTPMQRLANVGCWKCYGPPACVGGLPGCICPCHV